MPDHPNRRMNRLFGFTFDISVKWLVTIIVTIIGGVAVQLIAYGKQAAKYETLTENVQQLIIVVKETNEKNVHQDIIDATQNADIAELKRRMNGHDRRIR